MQETKDIVCSICGFHMLEGNSCPRCHGKEKESSEGSEKVIGGEINTGKALKPMSMITECSNGRRSGWDHCKSCDLVNCSRSTFYIKRETVNEVVVEGIKIRRKGISLGSSGDRQPRGYIKNTVIEMMRLGTTEEELEAFVKNIGYGRSKMLWCIREYTKKGILKEKNGKLILVEKEK